MLGTPEADVPTILPEKLNQWYQALIGGQLGL